MTLLKNLLDSNNPYISVFNVFKIIKEKTELKSDQEIADLLITIKINDVSIPFDKFKYFDGEPERLHRHYQQNQLSKMDLLLLEIARGEVNLNDDDQRLKSFVWYKSSFFYDFEDITKISLEEYEQQDDEINLNLEKADINTNEFKQSLKDQQNNNIGNPSIGHTPLEHYQQQLDKLLKENEILKELITNFETEKIQFQETQNAISKTESLLLNSDLLLMSALLNMLQNEIKVKANKSQAKILQKIENEHTGIKGLSKSRTEKIIADANRIYKPLIKNKMK